MPPAIRQDLLSRTLDHDTVLAALDAPVLIPHGLEDDIVLSTMADHNASLIPGAARTSYYPRVGHAIFWEAPDRFNSELHGFAESL